MGTVKLPFYARLALILLAVVLIVMMLSVAKNIFIPLVFALLIAILLYPLNKFFEYKLRLGHTFAPLLSIILFVSVLSSFVYFLVVQFIGFSSDFPLLRTRFQEMFINLQHWMSHKLNITTKQQAAYIDRSVTGLLDSAGESVRNVLFSVTGIMLMFIFIFIFTFFILYHRKLLLKFVTHLFSKEHRPKVQEVILETKAMIYSYVQGLVIEMVVLSIVTCTIFLIMGIKYALLLGMMASVLNIIPYLGIYSAIVVSMLVTLANSNINAALGVGIALFIIHVLDSNVLFPRIVGGRVKMNPFITIVTVIVGEYVWGIPGMFLFIPIMGIIKLICERVDGLEAWAYLIGVEDHLKPVPENKKVDLKE